MHHTLRTRGNAMPNNTETAHADNAPIAPPPSLTPAWIAVLITVLVLCAGIVGQWSLFATTKYVDDKVSAIEKTQNQQYIDLLKGINEIKLLLKDKQDRKDGNP